MPNKQSLKIENIYPYVQYLCARKGLTVRDVESVIACSPGYLSRCASGSKNISLKTALALSEFFDVSLETLMSGPPKRTNGDVFLEVFGFIPDELTVINPSKQWLDMEYVDPAAAKKVNGNA